MALPGTLRGGQPPRSMELQPKPLLDQGKVSAPARAVTVLIFPGAVQQ